MTYYFELSQELESTLSKLGKKDRTLALAVRKKIGQIISCDEAGIRHYKNLSCPLSGLKSVHVGSFVLLFRVKGETVYFERLAQHDQAYD